MSVYVCRKPKLGFPSIQAGGTGICKMPGCYLGDDQNAGPHDCVASAHD